MKEKNKPLAQLHETVVTHANMPFVFIKSI